MNTNTENDTVQQNIRTKKAGKTLTFSLIAAVVVGMVSLPASANKYRNNSNYNNGSYQNTSYDSSENSSFEYAKVVNVNPVVETYRVNKPVEQCWSEQVSVNSPHRDSHAKTKTPTIVGAIIGGIIGNQVGKRGGGKARDVATVAGAVLGGSIGRDTKNNSNRYNDRHNDRYETARYQTVQRCELKDSFITQEQVVAYDVEYRYRGNVFHTQMAEHPGKQIKVRVTVSPV